MKNSFLLPMAGAFFLLASCQPTAQNEDTLKAYPSVEEMSRPFGEHDVQNFASPDRVHYPETWFHYIGGNVSHEGITADL